MVKNTQIMVKYTQIMVKNTQIMVKNTQIMVKNTQIMVKNNQKKLTFCNSLFVSWFELLLLDNFPPVKAWLIKSDSVTFILGLFLMVSISGIVKSSR